MESNLDHYKDWLAFLKKVSNYFDEKAFLEVKTPILVPSGAIEATLDSFKVEEAGYLPTSPEFALKKLWLSGISSDLYEISASFRRGEPKSGWHLPEFTMLEFYMAAQNLEKLKETTRDFLLDVFSLAESDCKSLKLNECFLDFTGFELKPDSGSMFLKQVLDFHGQAYGEAYSWNDLYQVIYLNLIEPLLCKDSLIFLENYPPQLAALAKINKEGWASRLEVFYKGVELGNGYDELLNSEEIRRRWDKENAERLSQGLEPHPVDRELLEITKGSGVKAGVGIAIGLERVFAVLKERKKIQVWPFDL